jgi:hypothetical protein
MGWMAPLRHQCAKLVFSENHQEREPSMSEITTINSFGPGRREPPNCMSPGDDVRFSYLESL